MRNSVLGVSAGLLSAGAVVPEMANAEPSRTEQAPDPDFPFERLSKSEKPDDIATLLEHVDDWAYRPGAEKFGVETAKQYPYLFMQHAKRLLHSDIPWGREACNAIFAAEWDGDSLRRSVQQYLDVHDPTVVELLRENIATSHEAVIQMWFAKDVFTPAHRDLVADAAHAAAVHSPYMVLQFLNFDDARFAEIIPDARERDGILARAIINGIDSGDDWSLEEMIHSSMDPKIRRIITKEYGWEKFMDRCAERVPGAVLNYMHSNHRAVGQAFVAPEKRMALYASAADRDPMVLVGESAWLENDRSLGKANLADARRLVERAHYNVATTQLDDLQYEIRPGSWLLRPEALAQHSGYRDGLRVAAENDPAAVLEIFKNAPEEFDEYRIRAAQSAIEKDIWSTGIYQRLSYTTFEGLPNEGALEEQWFARASVVSPDNALNGLLSSTERPAWHDDLLRQAATYIDDPRLIDRYLERNAEKLQDRDIEILLGARSQDDFAVATKTADKLLERRPKDAYRLLWILEEAQPFEYAQWAKTADPKWKKAVTKTQWDSLAGHADIIAANTAYDAFATSIVDADMRFDEAAFMLIAGMNYHHRVATTVGEINTPRRYEGRNFVSIPMAAYTTIVTSEAFEDYLAVHAREKLSVVNASSTAQSAFRRLRDLHLPPTNDNIKRALDDIEQQWERVKNVEVFGPHTKLIAFVHSEDRFSADKIVDELLVAHGGKKSQVEYTAKGSKDKGKTLDMVGEYRPDQDMTIVFNGHGGKTDLWLDENTPLNYKELGDSLIASRNIDHTRLVIGSCYSYDFAENLLDYLREKDVDTTGLIIVTEANQDALGFGGRTNLDSMYFTAVNDMAKGKAITVNTFRAAETSVWLKEDPAIMLGLPTTAGWMTGIDVADAKE